MRPGRERRRMIGLLVKPARACRHFARVTRSWIAAGLLAVVVALAGVASAQPPGNGSGKNGNGKNGNGNGNGGRDDRQKIIVSVQRTAS